MSRFPRLSVYQTLIDQGLVPLFYHADFETALRVMAALYAGGSRVLEFTNRGDFALDVFRSLVQTAAREHPDLIVGVGTVDDAATAALYLANGADFVVGPTFVPEVARLCNRRKIAYLPGCSTVNEIALAEEYGAEIVKLFSGETVGGPAFIKAILAPRPWTRLMPSGGVTPEESNLREWFAAGAACVGMGSSLLRKDWLAAGEFESIERVTRGVLDTIRRVRG
jgi:2-dehydro-3-deoxyphosphogluconate aldolase/(4S)-4-hydroxy-2-oxoglutarate aldolase